MTPKRISKRVKCRHIEIEHLPPLLDVRWRRCIDCREWLSLGPSNDSIPDEEMKLAEYIADVCQLWEPGPERARKLDGHISFYVFALSLPTLPTSLLATSATRSPSSSRGGEE